MPSQQKRMRSRAGEPGQGQRPRPGLGMDLFREAEWDNLWTEAWRGAESVRDSGDPSTSKGGTSHERGVRKRADPMLPKERGGGCTPHGWGRQRVGERD
jgi:hypothetical protein